MTYPESIKYLESLINYEKIPVYPYEESLKLERIKGFLSLVGNPQDSLKCIHVAGTKGKGSTCAFTAYILKEAGFKVGLYTSPHLLDFRERIRILNRQQAAGSKGKDFEGMISKRGLVNLVEKFKPAIDNYNKISRYGPLTFFEVYTAMAFEYFKNKKTDFVVLETGLGGRLDATNAASAMVCAITPISYEHADKLGKTLAAIAGEKAGIIKSRKAPVICAPQEKEALEVIRKQCAGSKTVLSEVNRNMLRRFKTRLLGAHQQINANVAAKIISAVPFNGVKISQGQIQKGIYNTFWPGRCEIIAKRPFIILDGAQNAASAKALKQSIKENFQYKKLILVLGISGDKDIPGICRELRGISDMVFLTKADNPRACEPQDLTRYFQVKALRKTKSVKEALILAKKQAGEEDLILVAGSLFVAGEARKWLRHI